MVEDKYVVVAHCAKRLGSPKYSRCGQICWPHAGHELVTRNRYVSTQICELRNILTRPCRRKFCHNEEGSSLRRLFASSLSLPPLSLGTHVGTDSRFAGSQCVHGKAWFQRRRLRISAESYMVGWHNHK